MKVLFDSQAFDMQSHGGVSRYIAEITQHFPSEVTPMIGVLETDNVYLKQMGYPSCGNLYENFISKQYFPMKRMLYKAYYNIKYGHPGLWDHTPKINQLYSEHLIKQMEYDIFHATYFDGYFLKALEQRPFILTVHDMISELYPNYYEPTHSLVTGKKLLVPKAAHIIAVSQKTKEDLMRIMHVPEDKITVIYHGVDDTPYTPSAESLFDFEYILFVGERHFYKNFSLFVRDVIPVLKRHQELKVVCTGKPFNSDEQLLMKSHSVEDRFVQYFVKTNQEFMDLYHHAFAFVYPSAYEGFGMPILEAYKAGCPVMLNCASCFPEIAGDAAVYFTVEENFSDFEEQFETLYHLDSNERTHLIAKQQERLKRYSWQQSAEKHAAVYRRFC